MLNRLTNLRTDKVFRLSRPAGLVAALSMLVLSACSSTETLLNQPTLSGGATILPYDTSLHKRPVHIFNALTLENKIRVQKLQPRLDNLFVILDVSDVMHDEYRDVSLEVYAREMLRRFNKSMPEGFNGTVYIYDGSSRDADLPAFLVSAGKLGHYNPAELQSKLDDDDSLLNVGHGSLASAIDQVTAQIMQTPGRSALLLVTRWQQIGKAEKEAIARLRQKTTFSTGQTVSSVVTDWQSIADQSACVYAIGVGNAFSRVAYEASDTCGFGIAADKVAQPRDMMHFVERILFRGPADQDGDGIFDYQDRCPNTVSGRLVRFDGCYRFGAVDDFAAASGAPLEGQQK